MGILSLLYHVKRRKVSEHQGLPITCHAVPVILPTPPAVQQGFHLLPATPHALSKQWHMPFQMHPVITALFLASVCDSGCFLSPNQTPSSTLQVHSFLRVPSVEASLWPWRVLGFMCQVVPMAFCACFWYPSSFCFVFYWLENLSCHPLRRIPGG